MLSPTVQKATGALLIVIWSVVRIAFWGLARGRSVTISDATTRRKALLSVVSLSLVPIYLYYFTPLLDRFSLARPLWIGWVGNVMLAAAVLLFTWSHVSLGTNWSVGVDSARGQRLITNGPYRWVRHPMYSSLFLMTAALLVATANPLAALPFTIAITAMYADRVGAEERVMTRVFGDQYTQYMSRTGRLLPYLSMRKVEGRR